MTSELMHEQMQQLEDCTISIHIYHVHDSDNYYGVIAIKRARG